MNQTITGIGYVRAPTVVNNQNVGGTPVCHTGQSTGYSCGTVSTVISGIGNGGCNSSVLGKILQTACAQTLIGVEGPTFKIAKGDSGGPLFDGTGKAYGIASAMGRTDYGIFSSLAYLSNFTLKTGG